MEIKSAGTASAGEGDLSGTGLTTGKTIIVGIPAHNEEVAIGSIVLQAQRHVDKVIVVDDGSSDDTVRIATEAGAAVIQHEDNKGKGGAIRTLLQHVQEENGDTDALVLLDGDGQHVPSDIPHVAEPVLAGDCDIAIGSRYIEQDKTETPLYRRFGQRVLDLLTAGSSGEKLKDSQSGFRALSPRAVSKLNIRTDGMGVESEMIGSAVENDLDVSEVPIDVRYDGINGQTHNPFRHGLKVAVFLMQLIRDRHPLLFFGVPALFLLMLGGSVMTHSAYLYQTTGAFYQWRMLLSGATIMIGMLSAFCGLVLSQIRNMIRESDL